MPKKKKSSKKAVRVENNEADNFETTSVFSVASGSSETPTLPSTDVEDVAVLQNVMDRINTAIESLLERRPEPRIKALNFLLDAFRMHYLNLDESWNYSDTFLSGIENVLKKGKPQEQALAIECLAVFCFQFDSRGNNSYFARFLPLLDTILRDMTATSKLRASCSTALSVFQFLAGCCDSLSSKELMKSFEAVFKGSCLKGDGKAPILNADVSYLHITALRAWGLLFTFLPPSEADITGRALLPTLISLLQGTDVDMRIMAGETAALVYERIRSEVDERFRGPYYNDLVLLLNNLATDGTKSRSKVDRKKQRHSFRELVDAFSQSDVPETTITIGSEFLVLSSFSDHFQYDFLCYLLKGGMCCHLKENYLVREFFDLGLPVLVSQNSHERRLVRDQRRLALSFASKLRTQKLSSNRDRRSNIITD